MRKCLLALLLVCLLAMPCLAAGPTVEEGNRLQFTAADQETTTVFRITSIVWASFTGSVIVAGNVMNLEDGAGTEVLKLIAEATMLGPHVITIPGGIVVSGLKAEDLTKGYITIYGQRL